MRIASMVLRVGDSLGVRVRPLGQHGHRLQRTPTETGQVIDDVAAGSLSHEKAAWRSRRRSVWVKTLLLIPPIAWISSP